MSDVKKFLEDAQRGSEESRQSGSNNESHDQSYFQSYEDVSVHELMLKDAPRTLAYKNFLEKNAQIISGKVVLDVGAGSGILSLFAAKAGAARVFAVEGSNIADLCEEIVKTNGLEKQITVIKNVMEKVQLPEKVDIIISEWMGFYLLHESMLETVIRARDKWLKDDGILLPSHATLYCAPVNMADYYTENFEYWNNVYGFDFSPFLNLSVQKTFTQPAITTITPEQCLSEAELLGKFDLKNVTLWDIQDIEKKMKFQIGHDAILHGFATWFSVDFAPCLTKDSYGDNISEKDGDVKSAPEKTNLQTNSTVYENQKTTSSDIFNNKAKTVELVTLHTSPTSAPTHWKQTVCFIPASVSLSKDEIIFCKVTLSQDDSNKRHYNMSLEMMDSLDSDDDESEDLDEDEVEEDASDHPVPCDCGMARCRLIKALIEKNDAEQNELEMEAEFVDVTAEVQAAQTLDNDSSYIDSEHLSESVTNDDSYSKE